MNREVYYVANKSNTRIVSTLTKFKKFSRVNFISIDEKKAETLVSKLELHKNQPTILIWPSGYYHYLSYYFDCKNAKGMVVKRNIDAHSDWIPPKVDPFSKWKNKRINFANHMAQSELRHNVIPQFAIPEYNKWCSSDELLHYLARGVSRNLISPAERENFYRIFIKNLVNLHDPYPEDFFIHISIDFDSVPFFPSSLAQWICKEGFHIKEIGKAVVQAKQTGRLVRLDFGGCMDNLPNFSYEKVNFDSLGFGVSYSLAFHHGGYFYLGKDKKRSIPQRISNLICSYVVSCYAVVLEAALFD